MNRKTKLTFLVLLDRGTAKHVTEAKVSALRPIESYLHTITADKGKEVTQHQDRARELNADVYFARPYHSWERGLNENTNGPVRQYFPKKIDFSTITQQEVHRVQHLLNTRPRKRLGYVHLQRFSGQRQVSSWLLLGVNFEMRSISIQL